MEAEVLAYVEDVLLKPLGDIRFNSVESDALLAAIASGRVWHAGDKWRGDFNVSISKRIREIGGFSSRYIDLPPDVQTALRSAQSHFSAYKAALLGLVLAVGANVAMKAEEVDPKITQAVAFGAAEQFEKSVEGISGIPVPVGVVEQSAKEAAESLTGYRQELVIEGAERIRKEITAASSPAELEDRLKMASTSIKRRAALGSEQIASDLVAQVREKLARNAGFEEYQWVTAHDSKVRHDHKMLDGRIFRFDNPPIVDTATGRRANPGEDHNCRCFARPILRD